MIIFAPDILKFYRMKKLKKLNEYPYICPEIIIFAKKIRQ